MLKRLCRNSFDVRLLCLCASNDSKRQLEISACSGPDCTLCAVYSSSCWSGETGQASGSGSNCMGGAKQSCSKHKRRDIRSLALTDWSVSCSETNHCRSDALGSCFPENRLSRLSATASAEEHLQQTSLIVQLHKKSQNHYLKKKKKTVVHSLLFTK